MKSLMFQGVRNLKYTDSKEPELLPGHVRIDIAACGICGTDMHVYRGMENSWPVPGIRGHEFSGEILACADDVQEYQVGDRVVVQPLLYCGNCKYCRSGKVNLCSNMQLIGGERPGGFAEQVVVPVHNLFRVPDNLPLKHAALAEPVATAVHALQRNMSSFLDSIAIFGAGSLGLILLQLAKVLGVKNIAISDVVPSRLEIAENLGATCVINATKEDPIEAIINMAGGEKVELVIDAAGISATRQQALEVLKPGGTGIFLALGTEKTPIDFMSVVSKEFSLYGTQCYTDADFSKALDLLANGDIDVSKIVTELPLSTGAKTFEELVNNPGYAAKVLLVP